MSTRRPGKRGKPIVVSVLIPVYNGEKYLAACLDSVLGQSLREIEIVCVDDGSTDGSAKILTEYAARDPRLRVVKAAENGGLPAARNLGLAAAQGRYAYFFDADDLLTPDALSRLAKVMDEDALDGVLFDTSPMFEDEGLRARYGDENLYRRKNVYEGVFSGPRLYIETLTRGDFLPMTWLEMWRKEFLRREGLRFCTDLDRQDTDEDGIFYYQAMLRAKRVRCLHETLHRYRRHADSVTAKRGVSLHAQVVVYCERVRALGEADLPAELRSIYEEYMFADYRGLRRLYRALGDVGVEAFRNPAHRLFYRALRQNEATWRVCQSLLPALAKKSAVFFTDRASADAVSRVFRPAPGARVVLETETREIRLQDLEDKLRPGALHLFFTWGYEAMRDFLVQKGLREGEDFLDGRGLLDLLADITSAPTEGRLPLYCPCCNTHLERFANGGYDNCPERFNPERYRDIKQDVICPACGSLPRHRILASWLEENVGRIKGRKILHFAPETSIQLWMTRNGVSTVTADLHDGFGLKLDMQATGLPDGSFDMIICNHVLEHVDDFRAALKEMFRILRAGGEFICSFPMDPKVELLDEDPAVRTPEDRIRRFGQFDHQRVFGMKADRFLAEAGFTVERIAGENYPDRILPVVGPADYDMNILFHCVKQE